ncbi:MAG: hypothetical protein HYS22_08335 [Deltaproteobacteria bacterium]|nr:hypothetical protein [Deltaproteobacteria bacterium]
MTPFKLFLLTALLSLWPLFPLRAGSCPNWELVFQRNRGEGMETKDKKIMVLSFGNQSRQKSEEWLSEAFRLLLSDYFSLNKNLTVVKSSLKKRYQATETKEAADIGKMVGAASVVYGFFTREESTLKVYARFVDVQEEKELGRANWTVEFPQSEKIFELFLEIADRASADIKGLKADRKRRLPYKHQTRSLEAFKSYILGRLSMESGRADEIDPAIKLFGDAISRDYNYVQAYLGHAESLLMKATLRKVIGNDFARPFVEEAARDMTKAALLHPYITERMGVIAKNYLEADIHQTAGATLLNQSKKGAASEFKKALSLLPGDLFSLQRLPSSSELHELDPCAS